MRHFLRKWYYRHVTYRVTLAYLRNHRLSEYGRHDDLETIQLLAANIVLKKGEKKDSVSGEEIP
ncbi:MAG: hypothetical protein LBJ01_09890 [Tannerella sp.]|jgi:hypothetical protein|nr:hypothetical protein [Tannerella sp.]